LYIHTQPWPVRTWHSHSHNFNSISVCLLSSSLFSHRDSELLSASRIAESSASRRHHFTFIFSDSSFASRSVPHPSLISWFVVLSPASCLVSSGICFVSIMSCCLALCAAQAHPSLSLLSFCFRYSSPHLHLSYPCFSL